MKEVIIRDFDVNNENCLAEIKETRQLVLENLKSYNYVVTEENQKQAKEDRAALNKLIKTIADSRKESEKKITEKWTPYKKETMAMEKDIKAVADALGKGINDLEEMAKEEKYNQIKSFWDAMNTGYDYELVHDPKYLNKTTSGLQVKESLEAKLKEIKQKEEMLGYFLPTDEVDRNRVVNVFKRTLDIGRAKQEADIIERNRKEVEARQLERERQKRIAEESMNEEEPVQTQMFEPEWILSCELKGTRQAMERLYKNIEMLGIKIIKKEWRKGE